MPLGAVHPITEEIRVEAGNEDIVSSTIPGGRCAVLRVVGHTDDLETAALYLYRDWLPQSGGGGGGGKPATSPSTASASHSFQRCLSTRRLQTYFYRLNKRLGWPPAPSRIKQEISQLIAQNPCPFI
ncbi:GyrI-like domain-containing protein [Acetobacter indonesiensis]|uniref:GyrI-like domain-containing protein n=1 Tax=Acetobacter indonesiensis TaxID=104101 RepID=UPI0020A2A13A|nr:GyrI-like domain-containing protein [Acetobacter indonesiensis]MCP1232116.1 GyrI-like domain-containing protein [Acetobacter indonesiensis]